MKLNQREKKIILAIFGFCVCALSILVFNIDNSNQLDDNNQNQNNSSSVTNLKKRIINNNNEKGIDRENILKEMEFNKSINNSMNKENKEKENDSKTKNDEEKNTLSNSMFLPSEITVNYPNNSHEKQVSDDKELLIINNVYDNHVDLTAKIKSLLDKKWFLAAMSMPEDKVKKQFGAKFFLSSDKQRLQEGKPIAEFIEIYSCYTNKDVINLENTLKTFLNDEKYNIVSKDEGSILFDIISDKYTQTGKIFLDKNGIYVIMYYNMYAGNMPENIKMPWINFFNKINPTTINLK